MWHQLKETLSTSEDKTRQVPSVSAAILKWLEGLAVIQGANSFLLTGLVSLLSCLYLFLTVRGFRKEQKSKLFILIDLYFVVLLSSHVISIFSWLFTSLHLSYPVSTSSWLYQDLEKNTNQNFSSLFICILCVVLLSSHFLAIFSWLLYSLHLSSPLLSCLYLFLTIPGFTKEHKSKLYILIHLYFVCCASVVTFSCYVFHGYSL